MPYIRIVEAIGYLSGSVGEGEGVCRGILDDDRLDSRRGTILRVNAADDTDKTNAIAFCVSQIGKEYEVLAVFAEGPIYDNHANYQVGQGGQQRYVDKIQPIAVLGKIDTQEHHADEEAHG